MFFVICQSFLQILSFVLLRQDAILELRHFDVIPEIHETANPQMILQRRQASTKHCEQTFQTK